MLSWRTFMILQRGFLSLSTSDVLGQVILCDEGCPLHRRMCAGLDPLDAGGPSRAPPTPTLFVDPDTPGVGVKHCV